MFDTNCGCSPSNGACAAHKAQSALVGSVAGAVSEAQERDAHRCAVRSDSTKTARIIAELKAARERNPQPPRLTHVGFEDWSLTGPDDAIAAVLRRLPMLEDFELPLLAKAVVEEQQRRYAF